MENNNDNALEEIEQQVKSKERVADFGEVFTNKREVNAMLDLVKDESYKVDSRFLEPACGTGNFLVEILDRKMKTVMSEHNVDQADFEKHTFIAVSSIYGIDIQEDNCQESRARMLEIIKDYYTKAYPVSQDNQFLKSIESLLNLNIILGNGLSGLQVDEDNLDGYENMPIVFSEFTFDGNSVCRKDFKMNDMIKHNKQVDINKKAEQESVSKGGFMNMLTDSLEPKVLEAVEEFEPVEIDNINKILT